MRFGIFIPKSNHSATLIPIPGPTTRIRMPVRGPKSSAALQLKAGKNLILDTTLADGDKAVAMVKELQAKGYEVEIRAMATHRLESELGVDERFSNSLERKGFGRYVPEGIRDQVYRDLPENLSQVAKETGTPVRIFNREGAELYDSAD